VVVAVVVVVVALCIPANAVSSAWKHDQSRAFSYFLWVVDAHH
jgi:hypothetical protein